MEETSILLATAKAHTLNKYLGPDYVVMASYAGAPAHPDWYFNLDADSEVVIQVGEEIMTGTARTVADADRERLFEPFFTSRRASGGTGLGLPIARSLLAASSGRITLTPSASGARFEVILPFAADAA